MRAWVLWWIALWWLWMLLVGEWNRIEWVAAAGAATLGATLAELLRSSGRVRLGVPLERLRHLPAAFLQVFVDFGILAVALVRRSEGRYLAREFAPGGGPFNAWTVWIAGLSPNAYVVDVDAERRTVLVHDLVPHRKSEEPA